MKIKELIYQCLEEHVPQLKKEREENLIRWRNWSRDPDKKVVVFGASAMCEICIRHLENLGIKVDIICDNNRDRYGEFVTDNGRTIKIVSVEEALSGGHEKMCILAVGAQHFPAVSAQLERYQISECVMKWHLDFYLETVAMMCTQSTPFMEKIRELLGFYDDEESLQILWQHFLILFELNHIPEELQSLSMEKLCVRPQYFLEDGKYLGKQDIMVDCGAYIGDTLEDLIYKTKNHDFNQYDCYELFPSTYEELRKTVEKLPDEIQKKVRIFNAGVGEDNARVYVMNGSTTQHNSSALRNGDTETKIIRLDDAYNGKNVTFIKMDIEGSEQAALRGAKNVIARCRPLCAVCIYHSFAAFWEVPQLLRECVPEYSMILRHHTTFWNDSVCYAKIGEWT